MRPVLSADALSVNLRYDQLLTGTTVFRFENRGTSTVAIPSCGVGAFYDASAGTL